MKIYKYATGQDIPAGATYLCTIKNGIMDEVTKYEYVWHYFLVDRVTSEELCKIVDTINKREGGR